MKLMSMKMDELSDEGQDELDDDLEELEKEARPGR